jgi:hypothetical protein
VILEKREITLIENGRKTRVTRPRRMLGSLRVGAIVPVQEEVTRKDPWSRKERSSRETRCYVKVVSIENAYAHEITDQEARAEGFADRQAFFERWRARHGVRPEVDTVAGPRPIEIPVFVAVIELDERRFLAEGRRGVPADPHGYVHGPGGAMAGEPEAIDSESQELYAMQADQTAVAEGGRREQRRREKWERAQRLARAEQLSKLSGVDVSGDLRVIDQRLDRIEDKLGRRAA